MEDAAEPAQKSSFVVARPNPPFLCPTAFKCLTDLELFQSWKNGESECQLRIVGGPGTGKVRAKSVACNIYPCRTLLTR